MLYEKKKRNLLKVGKGICWINYGKAYMSSTPIELIDYPMILSTVQFIRVIALTELSEAVFNAVLAKPYCDNIGG